MQKSIAVAHALADETRWRIAILMVDEALCVCELADVLEMAQSTVSSHLQVLRKTEMVSVERADKWSYYQLRTEILPILKALQSVEDGKPDEVLEQDQKKSIARLALRGQSECKGPRRSIPPLRSAPKASPACC